jgi:hypothetical protein
MMGVLTQTLKPLCFLVTLVFVSAKDMPDWVQSGVSRY